MDYIFITYITAVIIIIFFCVLPKLLNSTKNKNHKEHEKQIQPSQQIPTSISYRKHVSIVTKKELPFYNSLKRIADKKGMTLFSKVRMADIIRPSVEENNPEYMNAFNKIKARHIDFLLCNSVTLQPILAIELDDMTHEKDNRIKRDIFVDRAMESAGINILHTYNDISLETKIDKAIGTKAKYV